MCPKHYISDSSFAVDPCLIFFFQEISMLLFQVNSREISEKGKGNLLHNKKGGDFYG